MSWSTPPTFVVGAVLTAAQQNILSGDLNYLKAGELVYTEFSSNVSVTGTTVGTANTVVTSGSVTFDGATAVYIEFWCEAMAKGTTNIILELFEDSTDIGQIGANFTADAGPVNARRRRTPSAGSHTYTVKAYVDAGTGTVRASVGGATTNVPGYIRVVNA